jgi:hypothetical protein
MVLSEASTRDGEAPPREPRVEQDIADREHRAERSWYGDHVCERFEHVRIRHQMVLRAALDDDGALAPGCSDGIGAHGHPAVQPHDSQVHDKARRHERRARHSSIDRNHPQQQHVARDERSGGQTDPARADPADRNRLQRERHEGETPPVDADAFQGSKRATGDEAGNYGDREDQGDDDHGENAPPAVRGAVSCRAFQAMSSRQPAGTVKAGQPSGYSGDPW